jgi:hypothetical protein
VLILIFKTIQNLSDSAKRKFFYCYFAKCVSIKRKRNSIENTIIDLLIEIRELTLTFKGKLKKNTFEFYNFFTKV